MARFPDGEALAAASKALKARASALDALARCADAPTAAKVGPALARHDAADADTTTLVDQVRAWAQVEAAERPVRFRDGLRAGAAALDLKVLVLTREPLELRLPPLSVRVDVHADTAELRFAELVLARTSAEPDEILAAHATQLARLEGKAWDPAAFHGQLLTAWQRCDQRAGGTGDWVELVAVLPELALARQPARFLADPTARNYVPYPRVQLAYDLWRLRRDRALSHGGWRLTLGPATGDATRNKKRVFKLEDALGRGQWHLTLRFVPAEVASA